MKIAISKGIGTGPGAWKYPQYAAWIHTIDPSVQIVELSSLPQNDALRALETCDGLVLSGGPDIDPALYGRRERRSECTTDRERDAHERDYVACAAGRNLPILGICRGMQLLNVFYGGSLVVDIPGDIHAALRHRAEDADTWHSVTCTGASLLGSDGTRFRVNSAHHQALAEVAHGLRVIARSSDGITEAFTWTDTLAKSFLLGVQWHPERMPTDDRTARTIAQAFLSAARNTPSS